jgi:hypothetical protein
MRTAAAHAARTAKSRALFERLVEVSRTARTAREQAEALGVTACALKFLRIRAKAAGFDVAPIIVRKLSDLEKEMTGPGCHRCHLRGKHDVCTTAREVAGFVTPSFHDHLFGSGRTRAVFVE